MEKSEIKERLLEIAKEELPETCGGQVDTAAPFVEEYDVDSVSLIKMIVGAEQAFDVTFDDRELAINKYENFDDMIDVIENKLK